jgi:serine/threonine protein kinase
VSFSLCVVHRDLAARNVLVDEKQCLKITDFGLARVVMNKQSGYKEQTQRPLPVPWMAPEQINGNEQISTPASDVWAYSVTLFEILIECKQEPYQDQIADFGTLSYDAFYKGLKSGQYSLLKSLPASCPDILKQVMTKCLQFDPAKRPSMQDIVEQVLKFPLLLVLIFIYFFSSLVLLL